MSEGHCSVAKGKSGFQRAQPPGPPHAQHRAATTPVARPLPSAPAMPAMVAFIARSDHCLLTGEFQVWAAPLLRAGQARSLCVRVAKGQRAPTPAVPAPRPPLWPALPAPSWPRIPDRNAPRPHKARRRASAGFVLSVPTDKTKHWWTAVCQCGGSPARQVVRSYCL